MVALGGLDLIIMHPIISVILPVYNESETLDKLKPKLTPVWEDSVDESFSTAR